MSFPHQYVDTTNKQLIHQIIYFFKKKRKRFQQIIVCRCKKKLYYLVQMIIYANVIIYQLIVYYRKIQNFYIAKTYASLSMMILCIMLKIKIVLNRTGVNLNSSNT